jgi:hypothetical protein
MPKASVILSVYAGLVLLAGLFAFVAAPEEANKATAIAVPGAIALIAGGLAWFWRRSPFSGVRKLVAVGVCLLFAALVAFPAVMRTSKMQEWPLGKAKWEAAIAADPSLADRAASDRALRKAFFSERNSPDHDQTYLLITLWSITAISVGAAGLLSRLRK